MKTMLKALAEAGVEVPRPAWWRRYGLALGLAAGAAVLTVLLRPWLSSAVFLFFYPALIVAAWYGGVGAGALVAVVAIIHADYLFLGQRIGFVMPSLVDVVLFAMFLGLSAVASMLAARARTARELARLRERQAHELAERLRAQAVELEARAVELETQAVELEQAMEVAEEARAEAETALQAAADAERKATQASAAKSQFLAVMSHELRTPLNAIMGYTDLLDAGIGGQRPDGAQAQYLERVRTSVRHLRALIDQVLSLSRIEAGHDDIELADVDVATLVDEAVAMCRPHAEEKGLALVAAIAEPELTLRTDAGKLRQILLNLVTNAVKFTDAGTVRVELTCDDRRARIAVSDTGIGIPSEHQARVFDPFTQVDPSPTRRGGGIGLGLPVSRRLAELLGGELMLESTPGQGSTFTVTLPARAPVAR